MTVIPFDRTYQRDHERSVYARMETGREPRTLAGYLRWYAEAWRAETPDSLHDPGVWRDYGEQGQGGSALGSPRYSDSFRRYLENSAHETDEDGYLVRPLHSALARIESGTQRHPGKPLTVEWLWSLARCGFDVQRAADARGRQMEEALVMVTFGLRLLWKVYAESPRGRRVSAA